MLKVSWVNNVVTGSSSVSFEPIFMLDTTIEYIKHDLYDINYLLSMAGRLEAFVYLQTFFNNSIIY